MSWQFCLPVLPESRVLSFFNRYDLLKLTLTTSCEKAFLNV